MGKAENENILKHSVGLNNENFRRRKQNKYSSESSQLSCKVLTPLSALFLCSNFHAAAPEQRPCCKLATDKGQRGGPSRQSRSLSRRQLSSATQRTRERERRSREQTSARRRERGEQVNTVDGCCPD